MGKREIPASFSESEIARMNDKFVLAVDKWCRMMMGISSSLDRYEEGIIYLSIENTGIKEESDAELAYDFVEKWVEYFKGLEEAKGFTVALYKTSFTGTLVDNSDTHRLTETVSTAVERPGTAEESKKLVGIYSGFLDSGKVTNHREEKTEIVFVPQATDRSTSNSTPAPALEGGEEESSFAVHHRQHKRD